MPSVEERLEALEERVDRLEGHQARPGTNRNLPPQLVRSTPATLSSHDWHGWWWLGAAILLWVFAGPIQEIVDFDPSFLGWILAIIGFVMLLRRKPTSIVNQSPIPATPGSPLPPPHSSTATGDGNAKESLELHIGSYWFSRIGMALLVIGIAFFLIYALRYFGPAGRIILGTVTGAVLIGFGLGLKKNLPSYSQILIAGGGAILYFTSYASYFFDASRVLPATAAGQVVALLLMALVAIGLLWSALKTENETLIGLAFILGYATVNLGDIASFSLLALLILTIILVASLPKKHRSLFLSAGMVLTYLTHARWLIAPTSGTGLDSLAPMVAFWWSSLLLAGYFLFYSLPNLFVQPDADEGTSPSDHLLSVLLLIGLNGLGFASLFAVGLSRVFPNVQAWGILLLFLTFIHWSFSLAAYFLTPTVSYRRIWFGWGLVSLILAIPILYSGFGVAGLWLALLVGLAVIGSFRPTQFIKDFGYTLNTLLLIDAVVYLASDTRVFAGTHLALRLVYFPIYALVAFGIGQVFRRTDQTTNGHVLGANYFSATAAFVSLLITGVTAENLNWSIIAVPLAALFAFLGLLTHDRILRLASYTIGTIGVASFLLVNLLGNPSSGNHLVPGLLTIGLLVIFAVWLRLSPPSDDEGVASYFFSGLAVFALWALLTNDISHDLLSLTWAILGCGLLILGVLVRDRIVRWGGILIFLLTVGKLFLIDTISLDPLFRIFSFIALGLILLSLSYVYSKYKDQLSKFL